MVNLVKNTPQVPAVLASLVLWASFAWGLPVGAPATRGEAKVAFLEGAWQCDRCGKVNEASAKYCMECGAKKGGEAKAAAEDPWVGVRISEAYGYAKCTRCGEKNEICAERCRRCGCELPQPSPEMTDPDVVFVPGKGYYREGTLLEPGKSQKAYWITGLVLSACLLFVVGIPLIIYGLVTRTEPVYAFASGECYEPHERLAFALASPGADDAGLKIEVTALSF